MSKLKALSFVVAPRSTRSPEQHRRMKLVERLRDQKALFRDSKHTRTVMRWTEQDGKRVRGEHQLAVRPWWTRDEQNNVVLLVQFGLKPLEFEKGKSGILMGKEDRLEGVLDTLIEAAETGALDQLLACPKIKAAKA